MDTKKLLSKLVKIAESQQKMINKLAQQMPPPQDLKPAPTQKNPAEVLYASLPPALKNNIERLYVRQGDMWVSFKEGQKNQMNYNAVLNTLQKLTKDNVIQQAFELKMLADR